MYGKVESTSARDWKKKRSAMMLQEAPVRRRWGGFKGLQESSPEVSSSVLSPPAHYDQGGRTLDGEFYCDVDVKSELQELQMKRPRLTFGPDSPVLVIGTGCTP